MIIIAAMRYTSHEPTPKNTLKKKALNMCNHKVSFTHFPIIYT